jgi:hypothetical protein
VSKTVEGRPVHVRDSTVDRWLVQCVMAYAVSTNSSGGEIELEELVVDDYVQDDDEKDKMMIMMTKIWKQLLPF